MFADGPREPDERGQTGPRRPVQPLVEQLVGLGGLGLLEDRRQVLAFTRSASGWTATRSSGSSGGATTIPTASSSV